MSSRLVVLEKKNNIPSYTHASWISLIALWSTMFRTTYLFTALSFGTATPEDSHRTRFTCPRPCLFLPLLRRFFVIVSLSFPQYELTLKTQILESSTARVSVSFPLPQPLPTHHYHPLHHSLSLSFSVLPPRANSYNFYTHRFKMIGTMWRFFKQCSEWEEGKGEN